MRESILKRRTRIDEVQVKGPSRELARLQTDKEKVEAQNKDWFDNLENADNSNVCTYCGKKFDRRAVLLSHSKVCQQKNKPSGSVTLTEKATENTAPSVKETNGNGWTIRDYDDSSNSNSVDIAYLEDGKNEKTARNEADSESVENAVVNKRKRNRALKAVVKEELANSEEEKSLNICWNTDAIETYEVKEESVSPNGELESSDSGTNLNTTTWNIIDPETQLNICTIEEVKSVKDDKKLRSLVKSSSPKVKDNDSLSNCKFCDKNFSNQSNLRRHITMLHKRPRRFGCMLCETFRAHRKIDVINHLTSSHLFIGDRAEALQYVCVKDEEPPKATSVNRRKEKHTEVLKDDDEELITIVENDDIQTDNTTMDVSNENSNADIDAEDGTSSLADTPLEEVNTDTASNSSGASLKRKGRPKNNSKDLPKKIERSLSLCDTKDSQAILTRRPVRNRIMPVKKDFVYDLSNLLKKEAGIYKELQQQQDLQKQQLLQQQQQQQQPQQSPQTRSTNVSPTPLEVKSTRRRNTLQGSTSNLTEIETPKEETKMTISTSEPTTPSIPTTTAAAATITLSTEEIKGAADAMARLAVKSNRAAFFKAPELPTERPLTASIKKQTHRRIDSANMKDWPILKQPSHIYSNIKSKTKTMDSHSHRNLKRKRRSCLLKHAIIRKASCYSLKSNIDAKTNGNKVVTLPIKSELDEKPMTISSKIADRLKNAKEETTPQTVTDEEQTESPTLVRRRMTLLERLAENKTRKLNESLSRMSIGQNNIETEENSD